MIKVDEEDVHEAASKMKLVPQEKQSRGRTCLANYIKFDHLERNTKAVRTTWHVLLMC